MPTSDASTPEERGVDGPPGVAPEEGTTDLIEVPHTGDIAVDEALSRLAEAATLPLEEQVGSFDAVHRTLQDRLADVEG